MEILFLACATLGGTILVCQAVLMVVGLGGDHDGGDGGDMSADHDLSGDHDMSGDHGGDGHDGSGDHDGDHDQGHAPVHGATWFFAMLSFRTVVAALTFFGLAGMAALSAEMSPPMVVLIALGAGWGAMYTVYRITRFINSLRSDGTARIERAVGQRGSVYLRVPAHQSGCGKIQINLQGRTMEYLAATEGDAIPTGAVVEIVRLLDGGTVLVQIPAREPAMAEAERSQHV